MYASNVSCVNKMGISQKLIFQVYVLDRNFILASNMRAVIWKNVLFLPKNTISSQFHYCSYIQNLIDLMIKIQVIFFLYKVNYINNDLGKLISQMYQGLHSVFYQFYIKIISHR